jgi:glucuronate isomerase
MRETLWLRLQMLPYNKIGGFFSDAYVADWVYGKASLIRKLTANVLAEMVSEGYMDKNLAVEVAKAILLENAKKVYNLS